MRTTVTIDDELLAAVKVLAVRSHRTIGSILEDALRRLLSDDQAPGATTLPDFGYAGGVRPGIDLYDKDAMASLVDAAGHALS